MRGSLIDSEKSLSAQSAISEVDASKMTPLSDDHEEGRGLTKAMAIELLLRGKSRSHVADRLGVSEAEVFQIESEYYNSQEMLGEHAMLLKQLTRLETLLDAMWDQVMSGYVQDPKQYESTLSVLKEISDLAGLKKTRVQTEVRLIQEQQVPVIVNYVGAVVQNLEKHLSPLLTKKGRLELTAHREEWVAQAAQESAELLEAPTVTTSM